MPSELMMLVRSYMLVFPLMAVCLAGIIWALSVGLSKSKAARYVFVALLLILIPYGTTPLIYSALRTMTRMSGEMQFMYTAVGALSSLIHAVGLWFLILAALTSKTDQELPPRNE